MKSAIASMTGIKQRMPMPMFAAADILVLVVGTVLVILCPAKGRRTRGIGPEVEEPGMIW